MLLRAPDDYVPRGMPKGNNISWLNSLLQSLVYAYDFNRVVDSSHREALNDCDQDEVFKGVWRAITEHEEEPTDPRPSYDSLAQAMLRAGIVQDLNNVDPVKAFHLLLCHLGKCIEYDDLPPEERPFRHLFKWECQRRHTCIASGGYQSQRYFNDVVFPLDASDNTLRRYLAEGHETVSTEFLLDRSMSAPTPAHRCGNIPVADIRYRLGYYLALEYQRDQQGPAGGPLPTQTLSLHLRINDVRWSLFAAILRHEPSENKSGRPHFTTLVFGGGELYHVNDDKVKIVANNVNFESLRFASFELPKIVLAFYQEAH
ncbi:uncharacterized protein LOC62_06G008411 [Vanrija pseudolonga]|uniref:USP domain-containing protein n=1 Tax=Vanrija pseudolonga TaxID=143232 RepID=A0AAF1BNZ2_9TREE|nr:hypothetical protein LOC62_06G008411 [Vanrija pseudolonga]